MKRFIALLCILVLFTGCVVCEEVTQASDEIIENITEELTSEEIQEEQSESEPEIELEEFSIEEEPIPIEEEIKTPISEEEIMPIEEELIVEEEIVEEVLEEQEEEVEPEIIPREVNISIQQKPTYFGDTVILAATLINFQEDDNYTINWQYCVDGENWITIEGAHDITYSFILDKENCNYMYRVAIEMEDEVE